MKKLYMTMVAMLCGVAAMAQTNELYAQDVKVESAKEAKQTVNVVLNLKNDAQVTAIAFKLNLPTGFSTTYTKWSFNEDRIDMEKVRFLMEDEEAEASQYYKISRRKVTGSSDYQYEFAPESAGWEDEETGDWQSLAFLESDGEMITIPLTIAAGTEDGAYEVKLYDISLADTQPTAQSVATAKELTINVQVGGTGINSINAEDSNAPVYNLAGQRVSKAQKGVFIQSGKKVAVK